MGYNMITCSHTHQEHYEAICLFMSISHDFNDANIVAKMRPSHCTHSRGVRCQRRRASCRGRRDGDCKPGIEDNSSDHRDLCAACSLGMSALGGHRIHRTSTNLRADYGNDQHHGRSQSEDSREGNGEYVQFEA